MCLSVSSNKDPAVIEAKVNELLNWEKFQLYDEVNDVGQEYMTVQWVVSQKYEDEKRIVKARLVAHGFQEKDRLKKDSPTASKESVRIPLFFALNRSFRIHSLDVKSAFLQGNQIYHIVFLKPPKEAQINCLWRLNKCVYVLIDASRLWYLRIHELLTSKFGMLSIVLDEAMFIWKSQDALEGMICLHVDDFIWAGSEKFKNQVMEEFTKTFQIKCQEEGSFKYIGLQIEQR